MAIYQPIPEEKKQDWINWLEEQVDFLNTVQDVTFPPANEILQTEKGDLQEFKDIVGTFLATLNNQVVTIN